MRGEVDGLASDDGHTVGDGLPAFKQERAVDIVPRPHAGCHVSFHRKDKVAVHQHVAEQVERMQDSGFGLFQHPDWIKRKAVFHTLRLAPRVFHHPHAGDGDVVGEEDGVVAELGFNDDAGTPGHVVGAVAAHVKGLGDLAPGHERLGLAVAVERHGGDGAADGLEVPFQVFGVEHAPVLPAEAAGGGEDNPVVEGGEVVGESAPAVVTEVQCAAGVAQGAQPVGLGAAVVVPVAPEVGLVADRAGAADGAGFGQIEVDVAVPVECGAEGAPVQGRPFGPVAGAVLGLVEPGAVGEGRGCGPGGIDPAVGREGDGEQGGLRVKVGRDARGGAFRFHGGPCERSLEAAYLGGFEGTFTACSQ